MNEKGRPDSGPSHTNTGPERTPTGRAFAGPPVPGRRLWLVAVLTCPRCGAMHQHRVFEAARLLAGRVIRTCPATGQRYQLRPVQRRREAVRVVRRAAS